MPQLNIIHWFDGYHFLGLAHQMEHPEGAAKGGRVVACLWGEPAFFVPLDDVQRIVLKKLFSLVVMRGRGIFWHLKYFFSLLLASKVRFFGFLELVSCGFLKVSYLGIVFRFLDSVKERICVKRPSLTEGVPHLR